MAKIPSAASSRVQRSYEVRYSQKFWGGPLRGQPANVEYPPGLQDATDIHLHANSPSSNPYRIAQRASQAGMRAIVFKSIVRNEGQTPAQTVETLNAALGEWAAAENLRPVQCFSGILTNRTMGGLGIARIEAEFKRGARVVWMPTVLASNSMATVGAQAAWITTRQGQDMPYGPLPWAEALENGQYLLDSHQRLIPEVEDILRMVADYDAVISFGHSSQAERLALVEGCLKHGVNRAFVDHPFSPIMAVTEDEMQGIADAGIIANFTFDEISPLMGVDPDTMFGWVRRFGEKHFTLSSDAGIALLPDSLECLSMMRVYALGYGISPDAVRTMMVDNPWRLIAR